MAWKYRDDFSVLEVFDESGISLIRRDSDVLTHAMAQLAISVNAPRVDSLSAVKSHYMIITCWNADESVFESWNLHGHIGWLFG